MGLEWRAIMNDSLTARILVFEPDDPEARLSGTAIKLGSNHRDVICF